MDLETGVFQNHVKRESWKTVLTLAYQSLGVVYGDLSTSPLYVYKSTFAEDIQHSETNEEIYGVLSFVFWTLTLVPLLKYVFIVLKADDNGEGGTFALYSLLCRHARINSLPNCQVADEELYEYKRDAATTCLTPTTTFGSRLKSTLEKHRVLQRFLLLLALIGTCMVIGDGVLTPALSVFSAVSGLELSMAKEHHKCKILATSFLIFCFGIPMSFFMEYNSILCSRLIMVDWLEWVRLLLLPSLKFFSWKFSSLEYLLVGIQCRDKQFGAPLCA
ncbi:hypothetical protein DKX38_015468 [Salix brachista]|uniref:K+ potassium transporter integral membrane domain-containing protein n=1 Tax=Salix brachista TaxID=2182728 RepID=A0A5N5L5A0_9ROSI|nr:hypothetical protein DKX38_015468 [Salix brachista]